MNMYAIGRMTRLGLVVLAIGLSVATSEPGLAQTANFPPGAPKLPAWSHLPDWSGVWERGGDIVWDAQPSQHAGRAAGSSLQRKIS